MASTAVRAGKTVLIVMVLLLLAAGGLFGVAHHAIVQKAEAEFADSAPASASFSRFKSTDRRGLAMFWKLRFAKPGKRLPTVGVWYFNPVGAVELEGGKR